MTCRDAVEAVALGRHIAFSRLQEAGGAAPGRMAEDIGLCVVPLQRPLRPDHIDGGTAGLAHGDLRGPEVSGPSLSQVQQDRGVGLQREPGGIGVKHGQDAADPQAGELDQELLRVGAQVARAEGLSHRLRLEAPGQISLRFFVLSRFNDPVLRVLNTDMEDVADHALADHLPGLADHRIACVAVGHADQQIPVLRDPLQVQGLIQGQGERLVAHDVDPALHEIFCRLIVAGVGGHDRDKVDPVLSCGLRVRHFPVVVIDTVPVDSPGLRSLQTHVKMAGKASRAELCQVIYPGRMPVDVADI